MRTVPSASSAVHISLRCSLAAHRLTQLRRPSVQSYFLVSYHLFASFRQALKTQCRDIYVALGIVDEADPPGVAVFDRTLLKRTGHPVSS